MREALAQRVAGFGTSIFTEMTALAVQHGAVNLGQGFPDFAGPDFVKQAATEAIAADMNQYAPSPGLPRLRQAIANQWQREHSQAIDWQNEVTITSGATEALCAAILALCNPGDRVIIFEPAYDAYVPDLIMAGAVPLFVRLRVNEKARYEGTAGQIASPQSLALSSSAWHFDPAALRAAFAQRPKAIVLNTPHNPTGKVFTPAELELIAGLCQEYDVLAISDEVYDRMTFDGAKHSSIATLPGMWPRTLTVNSIGKTFSVTGWKVGYTVGPATLNQAVRQAHQWLTFATATPFQYAAALAIEQAATNGYYSQLQQEYAERRALLCAMLEQAGLPTLKVEGSYFVSVDVGALGISNDIAYCRDLISRRGVAAIPFSPFYGDPLSAPPLVRFCFAKKLETIQLAGERLARR